jgi:hypothetical protein
MMNKFFNILLTFVISFQVTGQESIGPLTQYSQLIKDEAFLKIGLVGTFDSTTIYNSDTLSLPFLDEFSKKTIQKYTPVYTGASVTSILKFSLINNVTLIPYVDTFFSASPAKLITVNLALGTTVETLLPTVTFKYNNLATWPVTYATITAYPGYNLIDTVDFVNSIDTVFVTSPEYTQFKARQFFQKITDPNALWLDSNAYHNYTFSDDPRTLGLMTFDGVKANGLPYNWNSGNGVADILTGKPLNLQGLSANDSVYFSFLYQRKGLGEAPESSDKFSVEFHNPSTQLWEEAWFQYGSTNSDWKVAHVRLLNPNYFQNGFQFRFKNEGTLTGILDHWHLDYVHLRTLSGIQDTLFKDFAVTSPITTLLKDYTSVPWDHYVASPTNKMSDNVKFKVRNSSNIPENNPNGIVAISKNGIPLGSFTMNGSLLSLGDLNYLPRTSYTSFYDFSAGYAYDPLTPEPETATFDYYGSASSPFSDLDINDTTFGHQVFEDYYSYDDGSAEAAYGVTGSQALMAYKFTPYINDSLLGVKIHWAASVTDVSSKLFYITIWDEVGGAPGSIIYQDNILYPRQPQYGNKKDQFITYYLKDTIKFPIIGNFYIGWKQVDPERLNIGFDRNINSQDKIYYSNNNGATWTQSTLPGGGSMMMRPIFSTALNRTLNVEETPLIPQITVFPNPFENSFNITADIENFSYDLIDLSGRIVQSGNEKQVETSTLNSGLYLLTIKSNDQIILKASKIIKK